MRPLKSSELTSVLFVSSGVALVMLGTLILPLRSLGPAQLGVPSGLNRSLGGVEWGMPWGSAASPETPVIGALTGYADTMGWLVLLALSICILSLTIHSLGSVLFNWQNLVIRTALGARPRHLWFLLFGRVMTNGIGITLGVIAGAALVVGFERVWPPLIIHVFDLGVAARAGLITGLGLMSLQVAVGFLATLSLGRRREFTGDLHGDRSTTNRRIVALQSQISVVQFALLLVVAYASVLVWREAVVNSVEKDLSVPEVTVVTIQSAATSQPGARAESLRALWARQRGFSSELFALTNTGAWLGLGPVVSASATCNGCFVGQLFTPISSISVRATALSPWSLSLMGGGLVAGRDLRMSDYRGTEPVVLLNEVSANRLFPGMNPIGQQVHIGENFWSNGHTVVGVVKRPLPPGLGNAGSSTPVVFLSIFQYPPSMIEFVVPEMASEQVIVDSLFVTESWLAGQALRPMSDDVRHYNDPISFFSLVFIAVVFISLLVACIALVSMVNRTVWVNSRELAVRIALGAPRRSIFAWVLRRVLRVVGIGVLLGLTGARLVWDVLYDDRSPEGAMFPLLVISCAFSVVVFSSTLFPARHALRLNPIELLSASQRGAPNGGA